MIAAYERYEAVVVAVYIKDKAVMFSCTSVWNKIKHVNCHAVMLAACIN